MIPCLTASDRICRCPKYAMQKLVRPCDDDIWNRVQKDFQPFNVFVNIPYVKEYQKLQAAIIATVIKVGLKPKLASFRSEGQPIRLCKICEIMQTCQYCITDLSYARLQNMPFELGFFLALGRQGHSFILMDDKYHDVDGVRVRKFDSQLSNLKSVEILVHERKPQKLVDELLKRMQRDVPEAQIPGKRGPLANQILKLARRIEQALKKGTLDEFVDFWDEFATNVIRATPLQGGSNITVSSAPAANTPSTAVTPDASRPHQPSPDKARR